MAPLNVLICGGGVGGPAAAFWLSRLGHRCTIVERYPELRIHGQQIDLREQGVTAAKRMGIIDEVRRRAVDEEGTGFVNSSGKMLAFFGRSGNEEKQSFTSEFEIMRGELCKILHERTVDRVTWRFGITVDDFEHDDDGRRVKVAFSDGTTATYDLLIGADGQGSRVRRKMSPDAAYRPFGVFCCYFNMPRQAQDAKKVFTMYAAGGGRTLATRWHSKDVGQGYLMTMSDADEMRQVLREDSTKQKALFSRVFRGAGWQADRLVDEMQKADDTYFFEALQVTTKCWSKGRVVLLGDAAHAPSFFTGMGTSLALVGAYVLAGEIASNGDNVSLALQEYDRKFRPFVEATQKVGPGVPGIMFPKSAFAVKLTQFCVALMAWAKIDLLLSFVGRYFMPEKKQWQLPDYPELERATEKL
ncbi:hypothetical protein HIM_05394 [Hirsutella minnesotensis 3608]|uniref:FAD-binding domain-containing protein n=1 Tax=Hirsutella minnesotensis 3608 TaxID=1043627 RepID=A0A0F7ZPB3_9HYPO|nr:hypothetical protein HIM_05394 [Hirsutella minnesotensis 3608]